MIDDSDSIVLVGGGLASAKAAEGLRDAGFTGRVVLITDEPERPYERPPLSKGVLVGSEAPDTVYVHDEARGGLVVLRALHLDPVLARELVLRPGEGVAGRAFLDRVAVWTRDRLTDRSLAYGPAADRLVRERAPRAYLASPIVSRDQVLGVLPQIGTRRPHQTVGHRGAFRSTNAHPAATYPGPRA